MRCICALLALCFLASPAFAQAGRTPTWARDLVASDIAPTTGGRAAMTGLDFGARVTIAPNDGGVARVIRIEGAPDGATLALRRFTGHPATGWWLWGPDTPAVRTITSAQRASLEVLARAAATSAGLDEQASCRTGSSAYVEIGLGGRATSATRACVGNDAIGQLVTAASDIGGSRDEAELQASAREELLAADRAFAAMAESDGVAAAFAEFAARDGMVMDRSGEPMRGRDAIAARYANWPRGAHLQWAPQMARVSNRGDMGWTWGNSTFTGADGARTQGRYISIWTRDFDGAWRYAFDAAIN